MSWTIGIPHRSLADTLADVAAAEGALPDREDRLTLLDRLADRVPELDLDQQSIEWTTLDDGHEALLVNGGGIDGGEGAYFANYGEDVHVVGSLTPLIEGWIGCTVIKPDGGRYVAQAVPDPWRSRSPPLDTAWAMSLM